MKPELLVTDYLEGFYFYAKFLKFDDDPIKEREKEIKKDLKILKKAIKNIEQGDYEKVFTEDQDMEELISL